MSEFEYEVMQRKRLAAQAKYRKRGSKSKKCSLPSDRLTTKQWKERCGEIMIYNLKEPMTWDTFKSTPKDIQEEYINALKSEFNVNAVSLSEMFGVRPAAIRKYIEECGLNISFSRGRSMTKDQKTAWEIFLDVEHTSFELSEPESQRCDASEDQDAVTGRPVSSPADSQPIRSTKENRHMSMDSVSLSFSGVIDIDMIANSLKRILGDDSHGNVNIVCEVV